MASTWVGSGLWLGLGFRLGSGLGSEAQRRALEVPPEASVERHLGGIMVQVEAAVAARGSLVGHDSQVVQLLAACCLLLAACYLLLATCCLLLAACCLLLTW